MKKRIIKLINNERKNSKLASSKACDSTSTDICHTLDSGHCSIHSFDECDKDYSGGGCTSYGYDYCNKDHAGCTGGYDRCGIDY